jgi:multidrug efflux pump subunit AcrA (membrane-fusion protein)
MVVPKEAILDHEGKKIVYVLLSGEEFQRREVTLGDEYGGKVAILSGLEAGERVVTQGAYQLKLQELRPADAGAHSHET